MAKSTKKTKSDKSKTKKKSNAKKAAAGGTPKLLMAKGGLTPAAFTNEIVALMEDDLRISKKQAADFVESLAAVVEAQLQEGNPVNLFHIVKVVPRLHTKGEREVNKVFGDAESGKTTKKYPAKVSLAVKKGSRIAGKKGVEILPSVAKMTTKIEGDAKASKKRKKQS